MRADELRAKLTFVVGVVCALAIFMAWAWSSVS